MQALAKFAGRMGNGCIDAEDLAAYVAGELPAGTVVAVEAHFARCADCRLILSSMAPSMVPGDEPTSVDATEPSRDEAPELLPGAAVDRYIVLHRIGAGGMGQVYRARHRRLPP